MSPTQTPSAGALRAASLAFGKCLEIPHLAKTEVIDSLLLEAARIIDHETSAERDRLKEQNAELCGHIHVLIEKLNGYANRQNEKTDMSDTPRTDAVRIGPDHKYKYWEDFARELERENARLRATMAKAIEHIVYERDGIDGLTVLRTADWPVPVEIAQEMMNAMITKLNP